MKLETAINSLPRPCTILIVGRRGSGKDVTAHVAAGILARAEYPQQFRKQIYSNLDPDRYNLPGHFHKYKRRLPQNSVLLISDAHLSLYAREWSMNFNKTMDKLQTISRHRNIDIIYTTQQTSRLDINIVSGVDCLIIKEPSLMAMKFERPEIRKMTEKAHKFFKGQTQKEKWRRAVAFTSIGILYIDYIEKPHYWTEKISKRYGRERLVLSGGNHCYPLPTF